MVNLSYQIGLVLAIYRITQVRQWLMTDYFQFYSSSYAVHVMVALLIGFIWVFLNAKVLTFELLQHEEVFFHLYIPQSWVLQSTPQRSLTVIYQFCCITDQILSAQHTPVLREDPLKEHTYIHIYMCVLCVCVVLLFIVIAVKDKLKKK